MPLMPYPHFRAQRMRARLNALIRDFFTQRLVLEVETPILSVAGNSEPNIQSFHTRFSGHHDAGLMLRWLRTSPEYALKRLLAMGIGDCYELGRVFRNGEFGARHNPEFTLLEWYRVGWDHHQLMQETAQLIQQALLLVDRRAYVQVFSYEQLFADALALNPFMASIEQLRAPLSDIHINPLDLSRDDWLDLLLTHRIAPRFPHDQITVIYDWPASQAALAKIRPGIPPLAERFELYLGHIELANGYHELNDADEQRQRFLDDLAVREQRGSEQPPLDEALLEALLNLPDCAGVAVGIDRLLMILLGTERISDVLSFDFAHA